MISYETLRTKFDILENIFFKRYRLDKLFFVGYSLTLFFLPGLCYARLVDFDINKYLFAFVPVGSDYSIIYILLAFFGWYLLGFFIAYLIRIHICFKPLKVRDFLLQKVIFTNFTKSDESYALVLRSFDNLFHHNHDFGPGNKFKNLWAAFALKHPIYESKYNLVLELDNIFKEMDLKLIYVGNIKNCFSFRGLSSSLFLIVSALWQDVVNKLVEDSKFIIIIPQDSSGLEYELSLLKKRKFRNTFLFIPPNKDSNLLKKWDKITGLFSSFDIMLPLPKVSDKGCFYQLNGSYESFISIEEIIQITQLNKGKSVTNILSELINLGWISNDYYKECKYRVGDSVYLENAKIKNFFA